VEPNACFRVVDGDETGAAPEELLLAARFTGPRRAQFLAGRRAARTLTQAVWGVEESGVPLPPPGWTGSISHTAALAVAAAEPADGHTLGIDLEEIAPERPAIAEIVLRDDEAPPNWLELLRVFCLKEALYKALYPHLRRTVDFKEVAARQTPDAAIFQLHLDCGSAFYASGGSRLVQDKIFAWARVWK
jgi:4'-phosphopantetheinyl transferase EntD